MASKPKELRGMIAFSALLPKRPAYAEHGSCLVQKNLHYAPHVAVSSSLFPTAKLTPLATNLSTKQRMTAAAYPKIS
jgi:hypothetical protein